MALTKQNFVDAEIGKTIIIDALGREWRVVGKRQMGSHPGLVLQSPKGGITNNIYFIEGGGIHRFSPYFSRVVEFNHLDAHVKLAA